MANPVAFLATITTRLAINVLQSARKRRWFWDGLDVQWTTVNGRTSVAVQRAGHSQ